MVVRLKIMYNGASFCGWQAQKGRGADSVLKSIQGETEDAVYKLTGQRATVTGSGRTDAGVHALGQIASFELNRDFDLGKMVGGLNFYLPEEIRVVGAEEVPSGFNARFDAKNKTYIYKMYNASVDNPLFKGRALRVCGHDLSAMQNAAVLFEGTHDFKRLMSSGSGAKTTVRTVFKSALNLNVNDVLSPEITFEICANGFLYNMVRKIVGVLLAVGAGKRTAGSIHNILNDPFDKVVEMSPPYALYLKEVCY